MTVCLGIVRRRDVVLDSPLLHEVFEDLRVELGSAVSSKSLGDSVDLEEISQEIDSVECSRRLLVVTDCHPAGEAISIAHEVSSCVCEEIS